MWVNVLKCETNCIQQVDRVQRDKLPKRKNVSHMDYTTGE
jgi:hypothetical protein